MVLCRAEVRKILLDDNAALLNKIRESEGGNDSDQPSSVQCLKLKIPVPEALKPSALAP